MNNGTIPPMLFPYEPKEFWEHLRIILREEITKTAKEKPDTTTFQTEGLTYKPLLKISEVCSYFQISRPTIYDWIKHGKLKPYKIRRSVYFLWNDIQQLMQI
ncbi:MAG TPA: helix-turn-helix domain-containing protein [Segetibacter sp.]|jgi:excisionase family DNA binding protein